MKTHRRRAWLFLSLVLIACAPPPPVTSAEIPAPPPPTQLAPPPLAKRSAGLEVVFDLKKNPVPVAFGFGEPSVQLEPMRGRTFVAIEDVLFTIEGDTLRSDPALQRGLSDVPRRSNCTIERGAMGGHWPDAAWVQVFYGWGSGTGSSSIFLRWNGQEWARAMAGPDYFNGVEAVPLASAWSLVLLRADPDYSKATRPKTLLMLHPRWGVPIDGPGSADSVAASPDGTLYVAENGRVARWAPNGEPSPMPSPAYDTDNETPVTSEIVAFSPSSIFLLNTLNLALGESMELRPTKAPPRPLHQLLRFDGQRWLVEPTPVREPDRIFAGPRAALWVAQEGELRERAADGAWSSLAVPAPLEKVWVASDDDIWATSGGTLLLHTRPLPAGVDLAAMVPPVDLIRYSDDCDSLTALLDEVPPTTPESFDFKAQIDALTPSLGKVADQFSFYDLTVAGQRRLAAGVPVDIRDDRVRKAGRALVERAKRQGAAKARLVCAELPEGIKGARLVRAAAPAPAPASARH